MNRRWLWVLLAALGSVSAAPLRADAIDDYMHKEMDRRRIPGLALAVLKDGEPALIRTYGWGNLETETPVRPDSVFELASITKSFTAAAVMLLVRDGKMGLDDPIVRYLDDPPADWKDIRVRHLLTHTAGFEELGLPDCQGLPLFDVTTSAQYGYLRGRPLLFAPGTGASYSDAGYFLLGMLIEKASGRRYSEFMSERLFRPLGMTSSFILDQSRIVKGRVAPYALRDGALLRGRRDWQHELPSFFGVFSTIEDLVKWERALALGTLLSSAELERGWTPARLAGGEEALVNGQPYGFGWELGDYRGRRAIGHGGFSGTYLLRLPEDRLTVIVLSNLDNASGNSPILLARGIAGLVDSRYLPPHMMAPRPDPDTALTGKIRSLLADWGGEEALAMLTPAHRAFFLRQPEEMRKGMAGMFKALKPAVFLGEDDVRGKGLARLGTPVERIVYYRAEGPRNTRYFTFWLTAKNEIAFLSNYFD